MDTEIKNLFKDYRDGFVKSHELNLEWADEKPLLYGSFLNLAAYYWTLRRLRRKGANPVTRYVAASALGSAWTVTLYLGHIARTQRARYRLMERQTKGRTYKTKSGKVLTDADIEALADEAEQGYDVEHLK